jgi:putative transposase
MIDHPHWRHAPAHRLAEGGAYMVTAGTYGKVPLLCSPERLDAFQRSLFQLTEHYGWVLQAWAVMSNHYHFVAFCSENPASLRRLIGHLHTQTASEVNRADCMIGRKAWFQYWDTWLTHPSSYFSRINYVHNNPVHHHLVNEARRYPWCSARWFEEEGDERLVKMVGACRTDWISVRDDF